MHRGVSIINSLIFILESNLFITGSALELNSLKSNLFFISFHGSSRQDEYGLHIRFQVH
jgi:hypothetical protein